MPPHLAHFTIALGPTAGWTPDCESLCCVPLITRNRVLGTLNVGSMKENAFAPADVDFLTQVAAQAAIAIENATAFQEIAQLKDQLAEEKLYLEDEIRTEQNFGEIVGDSPSFRRVLDQVATVAPTDASVLILGETGTGKELIARAIHELERAAASAPSSSSTAPPFPPDCSKASCSATRRAHSPAPSRKRSAASSWPTKARCSWTKWATFPLELQPKLLRALQEHEFERLGGTRTIKVDVRLVAATNRDLAQMIARPRIPQRPLLPAQRVSDLGAAAARARRRHPQAGPLLHAEVSRGA